jgi:hypothetical protein
MMECKDIQENLSAYLEGVVSSEDRKLINEHLSSCQQCSGALEDMKKTGELLQNLKEIEPPPWLTKKIMSQVREESEHKEGIFHKLFYPLHIKIPMEAFATLIVVVMVLSIYKTIEPDMKAIQAPPATTHTIPKDEAPKDYTKGEKESPVPEGKTVLEERPEKERDAAPVRPVEQKVMVKKQEAVEEPPQAQKAPATLAKEKDSSVYAGAAAKDVRERKALTDALASKSSIGGKPRHIGITVYVKDTGIAGKEVEDLLGQLGARNIVRESREGTDVVTAEIAAQKTEELFEKLKGIGEMKEKDTRPDIQEGNIPVRIEIVNKS